MARTSKTKIGNSGESNDRMMRAASSGADAVAQAHSQLLAQGRAGSEQTMQAAQLAGSQVGQHMDRQQQQGQFEQRMAQDQAQFERTAGQRDEATELEAAKAGFEKNDGAPESRDDRAARLEAEMRKGEGQPKIGPLDPESQQRLNDQVEQGLEMDAHGRWRPTQERKDAQARAQKREDFQADTERIRALAYRDQVGVAAQKALAAGDKDAYEENVNRLVATPNDMQKRFDRMMKNEVHSTDWSELGELAKGSEEMDPTLQADIKAQQFTPRVAAFVRAQVQKDALQSIVLSKGSTNKLEVDWTAPQMRAFQGEVASINDFMRSNPALGQLAFIKSTEDKMRFLNVLAASKVLMGMTQPPSPSGGMMPATTPGGGGAPAPGGGGGPAIQHSTPAPMHQQGTDAVRKARAGGASPGEALQEGQRVAPTGNFGNPPQRPSYHEMRRAGL